MKKQINSTVFHASLTQAGLNASQLAKQLGVSREAVSKWQRGDSFPKPDKLLRLGMILNQPYQSLVQEPMVLNEPQVAYRAKANRKTKLEHVVWAKEAGTQLRDLVPFLPSEMTRPPVLKTPKTDYDYIQKVALDVRKEMDVPKTEKIEIRHFIAQFQTLDVVTIPVFWGEQKQHGQALHAYLPDSETTWVWLDLDTQIHDFMFLMAHELGHAYSPDLKDDDAEDFADLFAQALLYPNSLSEKTYHHLSSQTTVAERWNFIAKDAEKRLISPYTIIMALRVYAKYNRVLEIKFGSYGAKLARFKKTSQTVAEILFGRKNPAPVQYMKGVEAAFGTPFFSALRKMSQTGGVTPAYLSKTMDISLVDAKSICAELA